MGSYRIALAVSATAIVCIAHGLSAGTPTLMELDVAEATYRGKLVTMDRSTAWLLERNGVLHELSVGDIRDVRPQKESFTPFTSAELREALRREFGKTFEIRGSQHYLVCAPPGRARIYLDVFDRVYRSFYVYVRTHGFRVPQPEFPLVAIVFPDQAGFAEYCRKDGFQAFRGLMGYYLRTSNRVALYDPGNEDLSSSPPVERNSFRSMDEWCAPRNKGRCRVDLALTTHHSPLTQRDPNFAGPGLVSSQFFARAGTVEAGLKDTMIHEAVHQVAFNTGLHSRIGENPTWVIEGLATVFEAPGIRDPGNHRMVKQRLNLERYVWFGGFVDKRRPPKSLAAYVSSDRWFEEAALDAYSQAWALTFYLLETRPSAYARFLRAIAERDPLTPYPPAERLQDFQSHFGQNLDLLEADLLRFFADLRQDRHVNGS